MEHFRRFSIGLGLKKRNFEFFNPACTGAETGIFNWEAVCSEPSGSLRSAAAIIEGEFMWEKIRG
jgi:hypothetical protein